MKQREAHQSRPKPGAPQTKAALDFARQKRVGKPHQSVERQVGQKRARRPLAAAPNRARGFVGAALSFSTQTAFFCHDGGANARLNCRAALHNSNRIVNRRPQNKFERPTTFRGWRACSWGRPAAQKNALGWKHIKASGIPTGTPESLFQDNVEVA